MIQKIRLWSVVDDQGLVEIPGASLDLEAKLEDWLARDISMIDEDLLTIGRQVQTDYGGIIDLLCVDPEGDIVVLELKRARTSREITAQALDYASWIVDLDRERVMEIADEYLRDKGGFDAAFRDQFDADPPDTLNGNHRLIIVGSELDPATERIVQYLSDNHGVDINAVTFQFFHGKNGADYLARDFLIQPENVEYRSQSKGAGKRRSRVTFEQLQEAADANGVGKLYAETLEALSPLFGGRPGRRTSSVSLKSRYHEKMAVMLNLNPTESTQERGLAFIVYTFRLADAFGLQESQVRDALPPDCKDWEYTRDTTEEWKGVQGYFKSIDAVQTFQATLEQSGTS